jgi:hypothetical protein
MSQQYLGDVNTFDLNQIRGSEERICLDILGKGKVEIRLTFSGFEDPLVYKVV